MSAEETDRLHRQAVVDCHSDVLCDVARRRAAGESGVLERLHLPRWREAGVDVVVAALYVEEEPKPDRALRRAVTMLGAGLDDLSESAGVVLCQTGEELDRAFARGQVGLVLGIEGGECVQDGVESLRVFAELGVRVFGLTWNQRNMLAEGIGEERANGGLTELGRAMVAQANRLGILLDVSHLSVKSFWDLIEASQPPVIASHSNAKALCRHRRNLDDDQIRAVAEQGGFIGVNAVAEFLDDNPEQASLERALDHIDHIAGLVGPEHVALGPDFVDFLRTGPVAWPSGLIGTSGPVGFATITDLPNVTDGLVRRGYGETAVRGILGGNALAMLRVALG